MWLVMIATTLSMPIHMIVNEWADLTRMNWSIELTAIAIAMSIGVVLFHVVKHQFSYVIGKSVRPVIGEYLAIVYQNANAMDHYEEAYRAVVDEITEHGKAIFLGTAIMLLLATLYSIELGGRLADILVNGTWNSLLSSGTLRTFAMALATSFLGESVWNYYTTNMRLKMMTCVVIPSVDYAKDEPFYHEMIQARQLQERRQEL